MNYDPCKDADSGTPAKGSLRLLKKMAHPELLGGAGFMSFPGKGMETVTLNGQHYLLSKSFRTKNPFAGEQKFYESFETLELIDIVNNHFIEIFL